LREARKFNVFLIGSICGARAAVQSSIPPIDRSIALANGLDVERVHINGVLVLRRHSPVSSTIAHQAKPSLAQRNRSFYGKAPHYKAKFPRTTVEVEVEMPGYQSVI